MQAAPTNERLRKEIKEVWPELTRTYGLSPDEIAAMPRWLKNDYIDALPRLHAREQMAALEVSVYPHMNKEDQRAMTRRLVRMAKLQDSAPQPAQPKTPEEMAGMAAAAGIGFEVVE